VPQPDPLPSPRYSTIRRFWRIFRLLALLSIIIAATAVVLVARGDSSVHAHMLIATALGVGMTVLVGTALMTLVFLSSSSGHDEHAGRSPQEIDQE
jgi:RsiW-degrading membrane proteinase PrsW (M82 family)